MSLVHHKRQELAPTLPPIDAAAPALTESATFALG